MCCIGEAGSDTRRAQPVGSVTGARPKTRRSAADHLPHAAMAFVPAPPRAAIRSSAPDRGRRGNIAAPRRQPVGARCAISWAAANRAAGDAAVRSVQTVCGFGDRAGTARRERRAVRGAPRQTVDGKSFMANQLLRRHGSFKVLGMTCSGWLRVATPLHCRERTKSTPVRKGSRTAAVKPSPLTYINHPML